MSLTVVLAALSIQSPVWIDPANVRMEGYDRVVGSKAREFRVLRVGHDIVIESLDGIEGSLSGLKRIEMRMRTGAVTWLSQNPKYGLHLPSLSNEEWSTMTRPPRFAREDLSERPELVAKLLGKLMYQKPEEAVAGQDCFVIRLTAGSAVQNLWLDKRTGIALRQEDTDGQTIYFTRRVETIEYEPKVDPSVFSLPANIKVFRGLPFPEILLHLDTAKTDRQIDQEIQAVRAKSTLASSWIKTPPPVPNYRYVFTSFREVVKTTSVARASNPFASPELQPGGLPEGWTVKGRVDPLNNTILYEFDSAESKPRVVTALPGRDTPSAFGITVGNVSVEFVAYMAPDGSLVIAPGTDAKTAEAARRIRKENAAGSSAWVQSDFVHDESGDTVSFAQLRNRPLGSALRGLVLPAAGKKGRYETRVVSMPARLSIVSWQDTNGTYAFWSSGLSVDELAELADKVK